MKTSEFLIRSKAQIGTIERWTQKAFARDSNWNKVAPQSITATCFCSIGSMQRTAYRNNLHPIKIREASTYLRTVMGDGHNSIAEFNDTHNHEEVMSAWNQAIVMAKFAENVDKLP